MKKCLTCGLEKALSDFWTDRTKKDGHCSYCKICTDIRVKAYNKTPRGREKANARSKAFGIRQRELCLNHYGRICKICNGTIKLVIDHIGGNPSGLYKHSRSLWNYLVRNNFPEGFRTLCTRCNVLDGWLRAHPTLNLTGIDDLIEKLRRLDATSVH